MDIFTDGSCFWQHESRYRLAAWSVVLAPPLDFSPKPQACQVLAAAPLGGLCQTAFRAELQAFLVALDFACRDRVFVRVWTDCQSISTKFRMITSGISVPTWTHANSDLWFEILERVALLGKDMIQVVKVPAHEDSHQAQNAFENWMNVCNDCADRAAKEANQNRPPSLWSLWGRHMEAVETNRHFGKVVRDHMVAVAKHWKETRDEVVGARRGLGIPAPSWPATESLQVSKQTFRRQFGAAYLSKIGQWFDTLWAVTEPVRWVSYAQLYISYQLHFRDFGVWKKSGRWYVLGETEGTTGEQFRFASLCKFFRLMLQQFMKDCGIKFRSASTRPFSQMLQCHVGCLGLPIRLVKQQEVERWLETNVVRPLRGSSSKLVLPFAA